MTTPQLTDRQREVAELVAEGLSNEQIAQRLGCRVNTVRAHIAAIALRLPGDGKPRVRIAVWAARRAA